MRTLVHLVGFALLSTALLGCITLPPLELDNPMDPLGSRYTPTPPAYVQVIFCSDTLVELHWTDESLGEKGFSVERRTGSSGAYTVVGTAGAGQTQWSDVDTFQAGIVYQYRIGAISPVGNIQYIEGVALPFALTQPTLNPVVCFGADSVRLSWSGDASRFEVRRSTQYSANMQLIATLSGNVREYTDRALDTTKSYQYRVRRVTDRMSGRDAVTGVIFFFSEVGWKEMPGSL